MNSIDRRLVFFVCFRGTLHVNVTVNLLIIDSVGFVFTVFLYITRFRFLKFEMNTIGLSAKHKYVYCQSIIHIDLQVYTFGETKVFCL